MIRRSGVQSDLNPGLHTCVASSLQTEPSPQTYVVILISICLLYMMIGFVIAFSCVIHIVYFYDSHPLYFLLLPSRSCLFFSSSPTYSLFHFQVSTYWLFLMTQGVSSGLLAGFLQLPVATPLKKISLPVPEPLKCHIFSRKWGAS